jgi:hypothetical protein
MAVPGEVFMATVTVKPAGRRPPPRELSKQLAEGAIFPIRVGRSDERYAINDLLLERGVAIATALGVARRARRAA